MCAMYWKRHGVERPPEPARGAATQRACTNCGELTWNLTRGRCPTCYSHWRRRGEDRPPAMWQRGKGP
jgi:hypothetical protein